MYDTVKHLSGQDFKMAAVVKRKNGELLKFKEERLNWWPEHFQVFEQVFLTSTGGGEGRSRGTEAPSGRGDQGGTESRHHGRAPVLDHITAEMLKADPGTTTRRL